MSDSATPHQTQISNYQQAVAGKDAQAIVDWAAKTFGDSITFASSLGAEDQVLTDMLAKGGHQVDIFTLDTGRLFEETYALLEQTQERYGFDVRVMFPNQQAVEEMVADDGVNLFRKSIELRKKCCGIRKIEPLRRAFRGFDAWFCGLRRDQSVTRTEIQPVEWDSANELVKVNPLYDWTNDDVWAYIKAHDVPYNTLHDQGFPSIGCASCTRAVKPGEDIRAGRWWWEEPEKKECGLHLKDGKLVRSTTAS